MHAGVMGQGGHSWEPGQDRAGEIHPLPWGCYMYLCVFLAISAANSESFLQTK